MSDELIFDSVVDECIYSTDAEVLVCERLADLVDYLVCWIVDDADGDELLALVENDGLVFERLRDQYLGPRYTSVASAAAAASSSALRAASSASWASCFLDFLGAAAAFSPSWAAFTRAATASVS